MILIGTQTGMVIEHSHKSLWKVLKPGHTGYLAKRVEVGETIFMSNNEIRSYYRKAKPDEIPTSQ